MSKRKADCCPAADAVWRDTKYGLLFCNHCGIRHAEKITVELLAAVEQALAKVGK